MYVDNFHAITDAFCNFFITVELKKKLRAKREMLMALDDMKINVNGKGKIISEFDDMQKELTGSFRKLEVD